MQQPFNAIYVALKYCAQMLIVCGKVKNENFNLCGTLSLINKKYRNTCAKIVLDKNSPHSLYRLDDVLSRVVDWQPKFGHKLLIVSLVLLGVFQWSLGCHSFSFVVAFLEGNGSHAHQFIYYNQKEEMMKDCVSCFSIFHVFSYEFL